MKISDLINNRTANTHVCLFGPPLGGKTTLAVTLAEHFKLIYFDLDNRLASFANLPEKWRERIDLIQFRDRKEYPIAIETMLKVIGGRKVRICCEHGKVGCGICMKLGATVGQMANWSEVELSSTPDDTIVVIDPLTQLAASTMNFITKDKEDDYKPGWEEYRIQGTLMDKILGNVQNAHYKVLCISHEAMVEMEDGKQKIVPISGSANFSRNTAKYFDHVIYMDVRNKKHEAGSATTYLNQVLTGSRTGVKIEEMKIPNLLEFFKPITSGISKAVAPRAPVVIEQAKEVPASAQVPNPAEAKPEEAKIDPAPQFQTPVIAGGNGSGKSETLGEKAKRLALERRAKLAAEAAERLAISQAGGTPSS